MYPFIGLLAVPLAEPDFLLHLPDLYHEVAHPILSAVNNPKTDGFQSEFGKFIGIIIEFFAKRRAEISRQTGPKNQHMFEAGVLELYWVKHWSIELFCDLFATYTLGPAYAWSHLHLTAATDADPFAVKLGKLASHPTNSARMEVILEALGRLGLTEGRADSTAMERFVGISRFLPRVIIS